MKPKLLLKALSQPSLLLNALLATAIFVAMVMGVVLTRKTRHDSGSFSDSVSMAPMTCAAGPKGGGQGKCGGACGDNPDLDPVMSASYNMVQAVKQTILLEEHLNMPRKRCHDCITKHFLHVVGLLEEAVSLAKPDEDSKFMCRAAKYYDTLMKKWQAGQDPEETAAGSRKMRKVIMGKYLV
nr:hypothetical protein TetV2_00425 [Oceanusvirus sp.]